MFQRNRHTGVCLHLMVSLVTTFEFFFPCLTVLYVLKNVNETSHHPMRYYNYYCVTHNNKKSISKERAWKSKRIEKIFVYKHVLNSSSEKWADFYCMFQPYLTASTKRHIYTYFSMHFTISPAFNEQTRTQFLSP